jgi:carbamoyl-phosphate synthase/aspartate carbamoyltransferase/dihydroorotase
LAPERSDADAKPLIPTGKSGFFMKTDKTMTANQLVRLPGLVDVHTHMRVPGGEHKEDFHTGTAAALVGGFTTVLAMPNTTPPLVTSENYDIAQQVVKQKALCDVHLYAGASSAHVAELPALSDKAAALKMYIDQTYGPLRVNDLETLQACFQTWPKDKVIAMHAEGPSIAMGIGLAQTYQRPVHFCHVSRRAEIELIAEAKAQGLPVTCEVTPHHLFLNEKDAARLGPQGDMRPTLASPSDVDALWDHIHDTIDCIATDHAPHTLTEKMNPAGGPPGVPGLETALPLMLTAVSEGKISLERVVDLMANNPREIFNLPTQPETWIEIDPEQEYILTPERLQTKCHWSPFSEFTFRGKVLNVVFYGTKVVDNGQLIISSPIKDPI